MTLEEAFAAATVDDGSETVYCTVDDDTRIVTIPEKYKKLGSESDEKAKRVWFRFQKMVGNNGIDLSAVSVRVNFRNANGDGDIYMVQDLTVDGDYVVFSWELSRKVTAYKGNVGFVVCAVKSSADGTAKNEWNTTLNRECEVLEGLEVSEQIAQENPDIIEYILANLGGSVSAEDIATAVEEYIAAHPFEETDPTVPDWAKNPTKPTYTAHEVGALPDTTKIPSKTSDLQNDSGFLTQHQDLSGYALKSEIPKVPSDIGAESEGTAESKVSDHNVSDTAHNDIRLLVQGLTERLNALADSDDTTLDQMSEIVSYIKYNRSLINGIDTNKVDVSDIVNNLISNDTDKPLSAKQGRVLKSLIDAIIVPTKLSELENDSGYAKTTDIPDKLPNPQKLTFSGAITAEYDGSGAVTVTIPESSGGSGVSDEKIAEAVGTYMETHPIEETDPTVPEWAKQQEKPTYTASEVGALPVGTMIPKSASDVGADATGTAESKVSSHNVSDAAHNDIRLLVQGLTDRLNALADSDDETLDQMSEVVAYIKSNKSLIDAITTGKVSVSDIVDNLTTNVSNKPLSAAQGVKLKALIDAIVVPTKLSELQNDSGYAKVTDIPKKLPNPKSLKFTGAFTGLYDGSEEITVDIPTGESGNVYDNYYVTPEQFGAIGDGTTDDTEAFRQAIETELPIICMAGKDYYFANEIVTDKTRINIDGNYSHFTAFRLKINVNDDETNWKTSYPHPDSVLQNIYFMNKNNMDYCIKTGIPMKLANIDVYYYDLWLKNYGDYMDYFVFDNVAINSRPSNNNPCIELTYLGDNHVFRECRFGGYDTNINYVQVSGCKAVNFIDCIINGNVTVYQSVINFNACHFENDGQIIIGDANLNSVINFNGCFFFDQYTVTVGKNVFYNGCGFLVNYRAYGGKNDYMALNTRGCIIFCDTESANTKCNVALDDLMKSEYPDVVYSGNKVAFSPYTLSNAAKTWGLSTGTYQYKMFQSCNPYSVDYGDPSHSTMEESVTVVPDTSCVQFRSNYDTYPNMFIHAYRTSPDGSIKKAVIPITGNYIYDYGETLNGIMWQTVDSIPSPVSTTAIYRNGVYYSAKNYTNARNCICIDKANSVIVWIDENGSSTIISGSGSGGLTESQVNNLIDAKLTGVETLLGGGF